MVGLLTIEQKDSLVGQLVFEDNYYNPIQDADGNWVISQEEIEMSTLDWIKTLELIEYKPIITIMGAYLL
jgi:hypothetical protein